VVQQLEPLHQQRVSRERERESREERATISLLNAMLIFALIDSAVAVLEGTHSVPDAILEFTFVDVTSSKEKLSKSIKLALLHRSDVFVAISEYVLAFSFFLVILGEYSQ